MPNQPAPAPEEDEAMCASLLSACKGHPNAMIPWPHRLLHDAVDHITDQARRLGVWEEQAVKNQRDLEDTSRRLAEVEARNEQASLQEQRGHVAFDDMQERMDDMQRERSCLMSVGDVLLGSFECFETPEQIVEEVKALQARAEAAEAKLQRIAKAAQAAVDCADKCEGKCPALPHEIEQVWANLRTCLAIGCADGSRQEPKEWEGD